MACSSAILTSGPGWPNGNRSLPARRVASKRQAASSPSAKNKQQATSSDKPVRDVRGKLAVELHVREDDLFGIGRTPPLDVRHLPHHARLTIAAGEEIAAYRLRPGRALNDRANARIVLVNREQLGTALHFDAALRDGLGEHRFDVRLSHERQVRKRCITQRKLPESNAEQLCPEMQVRLGRHVGFRQQRLCDAEWSQLPCAATRRGSGDCSFTASLQSARDDVTAPMTIHSVGPVSRGARNKHGRHVERLVTMGRRTCSLPCGVVGSC